MPDKYLFVYGTLLQQGNTFAQYLDENFIYYGSGRVRGTLYNIGDYPGLATHESEKDVDGSIYQIINDEALTVIDIYEGCGPDDTKPYEYLREIMNVKITGGILPCFVYIYNLPVDGYEKISSGSYTEYLKQKIPR